MSEMLLTNNFYTFVRTVILSSSVSLGVPYHAPDGWSGSVNSIGTFKDINGNNRNGVSVATSTSKPGYKGASLAFFPGGELNSYFNVGSSNTPASVLDFELKTPIADANLSYQVISEYSNDVGKLSVLLTITATNDITIKEIGWYKRQIESGVNVTYAMLIGRCVLDTPISLSAGETSTIKVSISF